MHHTEHAAALTQEWAILQHNHEQHERNSLLIKLAGVALLAASPALALSVPASVALLLVLWLQEAILRTFQARIGERILRIEQLLREGAEQPLPRHRRERHRDLELGIILPAGALPRIGPAVVEHIFALAVALQIGGRRSAKLALSLNE